MNSTLKSFFFGGVVGAVLTLVVAGTSHFSKGETLFTWVRIGIWQNVLVPPAHHIADALGWHWENYFIPLDFTPAMLVMVAITNFVVFGITTAACRFIIKSAKNDL